MTDVAPITRSVRRYRSPIFEMEPSRSFPPLEFCRGTRPSHAANCRPDLKCEGSVTVAVIAVAVMKPTPGIVSNRLPAAFVRCQASSSASIALICAPNSRTCDTRGASAYRARAGMRGASGLSLPKTRSISVAKPLASCAAIKPNSARWLRRAFTVIVRWRMSKALVRCNMTTACCSGLFISTNRIVGRVTASQIAAASAASFFPRLTYAFTYDGGMSFTVWPSALSLRAQWCAEEQASMPTRHRANSLKNNKSCALRRALRTTI